MPLYNVHLYREMKLYFPKIDADSPETAAEFARQQPTHNAQSIDECDGNDTAALVDVVVVSGDEGMSKPDPRIFQIALDRLGVTAPQAVMVGDSWATDITGATRAGIRAVWFNPRARPMPAKPEAVAEIRSLTPVSVVLPVILPAP